MRDKYFDLNSLKSHSVEKWMEVIQGDFYNLTYSTKLYGRKPQFIYRARLNYNCNKTPIKNFTNVSDLWAPPKECVKSDGRCNLKNESTLYCSVTRMGAIFEVRPKLGDVITLIEYFLLDEINPFAIIGQKAVASFNDNYKVHFKDHFLNADEKSIAIDDCLSEIYISTHTENFPIYNLTNAVYKTFTNADYQHLKEEFKMSIKGPIKGILFPSVQSQELNFALVPDLVKPILKPISLEAYKVTGNDSEKYELRKVNESLQINKEGTIKWAETIDLRPIYLTKSNRLA